MTGGTAHIVEDDLDPPVVDWSLFMRWLAVWSAIEHDDKARVPSAQR